MSNTLTRPRWQNGIQEPFGSVGDWFDRMFRGETETPTGQWSGLDVWEDDQHLYVELDLPGFDREDVELTFDKGRLHIAAERKAPEGERNYLHRERGYGRVERVLSLPETIDPENVDAELRGGVLYLKLSKKPEAQPRRIEVKGS